MEKLSDEQLLERYGWSLDCQSPLNISHVDGSQASNLPARLMIHHLREQYEEEMEELRKKNSKVISPDEINFEDSIPEFVIEAVNNILKKEYRGDSVTILQKEIMTEVMNLRTDLSLSKEDIYKNHWLDFEPLFRKNGWNVSYDKPGYNESYEARFTFSKKKLKNK